MEPERMILRFAVTTVLAIAFGLARQKLGKPIGFGTFVFVSIGSCGLAVMATSQDVVRMESPLPLLGAIVTGVGFLGAGALVRNADRIAGFTSAATIWVVAIFGIAVGVGEMLLAGILYVSIWVVILLDRVLEAHSVGAHSRKLNVALSGTPADVARLSAIGLGTPVATSVDRSTGTLRLTYQVSGSRESIDGLMHRLADVEDVRSFSLE